ncbi:hypothetical protein A1O7_08486 [Cladophialophora yegresii CBS 114405]|uniref:Uncharacterized protein n=1 Tax=Cladophialophora yegresii CBS 114405 TaxID=1182544 RepID=W9VJ87_9EURO|nr:uncharacterized protein A1O7_08486 [Cladophialophora yegresii CBS 114405]EXJ55558.1 hypothetical protein A1O7_08486 [Cladophialophora yegresii CBS 114405]
MDTGLKKLWTRRKTKGNSSRKDSGVSSLRKSQSTEYTQHSSNTSPPTIHIRNISTDYEKSPLSPAVSNRLHPALGGAAVSRPSTSWSGLATDGSGSLLSAVNRAADAVAKTEQGWQYLGERNTRNYVQPKIPRYVDIFSLSSSNSPSPRPGYNEDVAERNLDLARVALEGAHSTYVPSSKYQEEVATRNAQPSLPGSPATSTSVRRQVASASSNYPRSPPRFEGYSSSRQSNHTHNSPRLHSRQDSDGSRISQQRARDIQALKEGVSRLPHAQAPIAPVGSTQGHKSASTSPEAPAGYPGKQPVDPDPHEDPASALSSYQLSVPEVTQLKAADDSYSRSHEHSMRPPSNKSNRAINLPYRTILDLTADAPEAVSESYPPSNYSSSPVLEHARVDTMRRVQGPVIPGSSTETPQAQSNSVQPATSPSANAEAPASEEVAQPRAPSPAPASEPPRPRQTPANTHFASSFTRIITIASASPRASVVMAEPADSEVAEDANANPETGVSQKQEEVRLASDPLPSRHDGLPEVQSRVTETAVASPKGAVSTTSTTASDSNEVRSKEGEAMIDQKEDLRHKPDPTPVVGPYLHLSSKNPEPPATPSSGSGVSARDFANAATKPALTSVPEVAEVDDNKDTLSPPLDAETLPRKYASRDGDANGHTYGSPTSDSTFNESEFAQKQAEAREALIRLQLSLNENFLTKPLPTSVARTTKSSPQKHKYSFSDGKPAAPSSIFSQFRERSPTPVDRPTEPDHPVGTERADSSYHHLTTMSREHSNARPREEPVKLSMNKAAKKKREKVRHGPEPDLNGPGPSIVNDAPKQHVPLPPPLSLTDQSLHPRFHQPQPVVPPSPGEVSLSNFPLPVSSPRQSVQRSSMASPTDKERAIPRPASQNALQHPLPSSNPGMKERILRRQSSIKSQSSSTSQFSIPYHMIPDRSSSVRDRSVMEDDDE